MIETSYRWELRLGDSVERIEEIEDETVGLTVFSPPFPGMYVYSDSTRRHGQRPHDRRTDRALQLSRPVAASCVDAGPLLLRPSVPVDQGEVPRRALRAT